MPRKTLKQRREKRREKNNRIRPIVNRLIGIKDPDTLMLELLELLGEPTLIPEPGKLYVFVYNAKTPGIRYDSNPLVAVGNIYSWGFSGYNFHWKDHRQYTWNEVAGGVYEVYDTELVDIRKIPFANFVDK